ncbi:isochorismatase domain-containing protein 1 isoform X3 [Lagenorhynchus albirostris]|uniref:isochorismatase domain-containing protein 1 isoform X3 n=1 Tax=Lagenorhynchus albirostris TaxID=27610 RepID=UPI0028E44355|nr:isochorismatase domain-containing protein 1 isoform X3 [Lagenorhynchus albirostris]
MAAAEPAVPALPSGGGLGAPSGTVPVLFCFSVFARPSAVPHGAGYELLIQKFLSLYGDQIDMHRKFVVQLFAEEWGQYVDLPKGFTVSERCKVRLVPLQIQLTTLGNLTPSSTVFFCCDMQERFRPAIKYFGDIISVGQRLLQGARILGIPVIVTEQYPKGLGSTVQEIDLTGVKLVLPKTKFSMVLPEVEAALAEIPGVRSVVLFGVETSCLIKIIFEQSSSANFNELSVDNSPQPSCPMKIRPMCASNRQLWSSLAEVLRFILLLMPRRREA